MPRCNHNFWLALDAQQNEAEFLVSDKLQEVFETIPSPDVQKPSLVVVIGEAAKKAALEIFGIKRNRRSIVSQNASEIHLHIDPSSVFSTPLLIAETRRPRSLYDMQRPVNRLHTNLLAAFTDVFCLFCEDFGGLDQTAIELASWLDRSLPSSVSGRMRPRLIVVVDQNPGIWANENNIREKLFELIRKHTVKDPNAVFSAVETVALFPDENFHPEDVVRHLYKGVVTRAFKKSVSSLEGREAVSVNTFVNSIEAHLRKYVESSIAGAIPTADIHSENLARFANKWAVIKSSDTCLVCLRRRPLYDLCPGHTICDNCVRVFGLCADDDPSVWTFEKCLLCQNRLSEKTRIRIHPPTAGVGVLCLDGGGVRGTLVLEILKRIEERVNLPVPLQRPVSLLGQLAALLVSYFDDGLYSSQQIESVLKHIFGADKGVLDVSSATANGNFVGLPVATVDEEPMCRIFTNRNGAYQNNRHAKKPTKCLAVLGSNTHDEIVPTKANKKLTLWEIARAASAAPGIFSPKHFAGLGTFQDAGPLENDPLCQPSPQWRRIFPTSNSRILYFR
uniref:PNPLA domain-containing protein n=1 Tax=Pyricularia oryzae (strain P131) TaxID=1143193 RepID=L7ITF8_PYRO1